MQLLIERDVIQAIVQCFTEGFQRCIGDLGEIVDEIVLELEVDHARAVRYAVESRDRDLDQRRAACFHLVQRSAYDARRFLVVGFGAEILGEDADASAAQRRRVERCDEVRERLVFEDSRCGVGRVRTDRCVECDGEIRHRARQRAGDVLRV